LDLLRERNSLGLDQEAWEFLEEANFAVEGMTDLVNTLLEFAAFAPRSQEFTNVDMEVLFYQVYVLLRTAIKKAGATITHDPLPVVCGHDTQLRQLLQNLVSNAMKYRSQQPPHIHVGANEGPQHWTIYVRDNGVGVAPRHQGRIFEMFVRAPADEHIPGTGIGLAFCKLIVENHGGHIWLESAPGEGSTFYFTIPKQCAAPADSDQSECQPKRSACVGSQS
jgi:light-regulated signal transduction histidine kinase (bacteriophytochrome)